MSNPFNATYLLKTSPEEIKRQHNMLVKIMQEQIKMLRAELENGLSIVNGVLSLALASSTQPGALSAADWNTFNNKQAALTFGIEDGNAVEIDDTDVANGMFPRFTANGLEGLSVEDMKAALNIQVSVPYYEPLTDGDTDDPQILFGAGDVLMGVA